MTRTATREDMPTPTITSLHENNHFSAGEGMAPESIVRAVVIAPTFNNAGTVGSILREILALGLSVIVVNDGSTDGTAEVLRGIGGVTVITHAENLGKAAALRSGFEAAILAGFTHAVTIDTDGQHDPAEIPVLLEAARRSTLALIVGCRDVKASGYPVRSRAGRYAANLLVRMESGVRVEDSQCGFRVYPLGLIRAVPCSAGRYAFETEIITRAGWAGCEVVQAPVTCRYLPEGTRVSHFRPWVDTFRGLAMHFYLAARAISPFGAHPRWPGARPGGGGRRSSPGER